MREQLNSVDVKVSLLKPNDIERNILDGIIHNVNLVRGEADTF